jgi:hypothetical protein
MSDQGFDAQLRDWMDAEATAPAPTRMFDQVLGTTAAMPQLRRWPGWRPAVLDAHSSRRLVLLVAASLLVALLAAIVAGGTGRLLTTARPTPTSELRIGALFAPTCAHPASIATAGEQVWVACQDQVRRFDPTGSVNAAVPGAAVAVDATGAWVAGGAGIRPLDEASGTAGVAVAVPGTSAIALDAGSVWAMDPADQRVVRVDRATSRLIATVQLPSRPAALATAGGRVFVVLPDLGRIGVVDTASNSLTDLVAVARPAAIAAAFGEIWVGSDSPATLTRLDPTTLQAQGHPLPALDGLGATATTSGLSAIAADARSLWLAAGSWVAQVDPGSSELTRLIEIRAPDRLPIAGLALLDGQLLILDPAGDRVLRLTP